MFLKGHDLIRGENMARMHSRKRGKSRSHRPDISENPKWVEYDPKEIEQLVVKFSKEGIISAQIGLILRDQYGIPSVKLTTKKTISQILKEHNLYPKIPEDLLCLLKRAEKLIEHMKANKKDKHSERGLQNLESRIRRLAKYYKSKGQLDEKWNYSRDRIKLLAQ